MDAAQKVRRSPRLNRKRRVRYEGYREASKHTVAGIYHNTKFDTLLATMTQCAKVLASFKRSVIAYRDSAVEFNAKLQVAATEIGESPATFREEIAYLIIDVEARDDEIARLKKENDQLKNEKAEIEKKKSSPIKLKPQAIVQPESPNALQSQRKQMKIEIFNEMNDLILQAKGIFDAIKGKIDEADEAIEFSATSLAKKVDSLQNDVKARDKKFDKLKKENCELKESLQKCNHEIEQMKTKAQDLESGMAE
ncbi:predicted protein [Sclerotinia sclerotiorum 1980 UF-70]|uniref:Uncharacterized protein n=1 Tax=Sclerotinia sclerotiorum (strain ATCC 18683 / 1980 / Ss-1) TaxID=665079 RepID=A7EFU8_SCLS1|nr:predicted protein [Sclerotinia sclerotiorum 1980 UF-70]EDO01714.1 predicted protein [Sclerotinia sclerotiorum 1980 UF-70]